jgi:alpha-L-fucosidase
MVNIRRFRNRIRSSLAVAAMLSFCGMSGVFAQWDKVTPATSDVKPSNRQLIWQQWEHVAFIHFGMPTYSNGADDETKDPKVFNPTKLDCRQWVGAYKSAGFREIVITIKHHDGFLIYPSAVSEHSTKNSTWGNGQGDVLKDLADACRDSGLALGIYYSPWDKWYWRQETGDAMNCPSSYLKYAIDCCREFMTDYKKYGEIYSVWMDGFNSPGIDKFNWKAFEDSLHKWQPEATHEVIGSDVRWVGNENGTTPDPCWAAVVGQSAAFYETKGRGIVPDTSCWWPSQCTMPGTNGWYDWNGCHSPQSIANDYFNTTGKNSQIIINFPPNTDGLLPDAIVTNLKNSRQYIEDPFRTNLCRKQPVTASSAAGSDSGSYAVDNKQNTWWRSASSDATPSLEVDLGGSKTFNYVSIQEHIALGQHVKQFAVEVYNNNAWQQVATGASIGYLRIFKLAQSYTGTKVRLRIPSWFNAAPAIEHFGVYQFSGTAAAAGIGDPGVIIKPYGGSFARQGRIFMKPYRVGAVVRYAKNGGTPTASSPVCNYSVTVNRSCKITTMAFNNGTPDGVIDTFSVEIRDTSVYPPDSDLTDVSNGRLIPAISSRAAVNPIVATASRGAVQLSLRSAGEACQVTLCDSRGRVVSAVTLGNNRNSRSIRIPVSAGLYIIHRSSPKEGILSKAVVVGQ